MKNELTIEQSQHLVDLGVDPKLASKCDVAMKIGAGVRGIIKRPDPKPIFDLSDVIGILPKEIYNIPLFMEWDNELNKWCVGYNVLHLEHAPELIVALYQLLCCWLTEFKKKEK